ncbi:MAG: polyphenol oxidase family protein, partial [Pseudomonadota bacterium]
MSTEDQLRIKAPNLAALEGIEHGFFTRQGGVSAGIYTSLNCGVGSRDAPEAVRENRAKVTRLLGAPPNRLASLYQKHSNIAVIADDACNPDARPEADGIVTATPGLAVGIVTADCAPVLFCDPVAKVIGAAHAGWRGAFSGIV